MMPNPIEILDAMRELEEAYELEGREFGLLAAKAIESRDAVAEARERIEALDSPVSEAQAPAADAPPTSTPPAPLTPKPASAPSSSPGARVDLVVEVIRKVGGRATKQDLVDGVSFGNHALSAAIREAIHLGKIERVGATKSMRYVTIESIEPATPPADRRGSGSVPTNEAGDQEPSLQGRVLSYCQLPRTGPEISLQLETPLNDLRAVLGELMRSGDLTTRREAGNLYYVATL